jgi:hypothetical protein
MKGLALPNNRRKKVKKVDSNINSTDKQTPKQQRQLNDRNYHIPINANIKC